MFASICPMDHYAYVNKLLRLRTSGRAKGISKTAYLKNSFSKRSSQMCC